MLYICSMHMGCRENNTDSRDEQSKIGVVYVQKVGSLQFEYTVIKPMTQCSSS